MKTKAIVKLFSSSVILSVFALLLFFGAARAANPQFNFMSNDMETLVVGNWTTDGGTTNWADPISANPGNRVAFDFYYHNGVDGTVATNTRMRLTYPTNATSPIVVTGTLWADNAAAVSDTGTINIGSTQTLSFENVAKWYPNQQVGVSSDLTVTRTGNTVEVNIGSLPGGWPTQGHVVFYANVSNNAQPGGNPVVDAGSNVTVNELQSVGLSATATDPSGLNLTYSWTCNGGSLNNSTVLNPIYTAPAVASNTTYTCTFTATNTAGNSASDSLIVAVMNVTPPGPNDPIVDAGANVTINEGQSIGLSGTATDPFGLSLTYSWACTGGILTNSAILNPSFTAPQVNGNTVYTCTLTARNSNGNTGSDSLSITVIDTNGGGGGGGFGGPELNVSLSANPSTGSSPLNGVDLTATVNSVGISADSSIIYSFDCENNGTFELRVETRNSSYTATDLCNYFYDDTYVAKVKVEKAGYTSYSQANIFVGPRYGGGYGITADAGPNKDITENQSTILNGYGYSQYGYPLTYNWTCNGGSLSNANSLTPTYYAPSVTTDITYTCILYVTDSRGYKNSDTVNIIVRNGGGFSTGLAVTTNSPTNVTSTYATLNGSLLNAGARVANVRFDWGRVSSYNNFTPWMTDKMEGQSFNYFISGLEKGKAYHYRVEASNGRETVLGNDVVFMTKPDATTGFYATPNGSGQVALGWNKAASSCYTMVVRKTGSYPANSGDGTTVYYGIGSYVLDKNLNNGTWYYYRAWSVGCDEGLISYSESQNARAYTTGGGTYVPPVVEEEVSAISVEALARDITQNEIAWQSSIASAPTDEIEFKIIITPTGAKSLTDVVLKANLSDKIGGIKDIKIDNESYSGGLTSDIKLGTIALGESKIITFKGKVDSNSNFSYGSNKLANSFEVTAGNNGTTKKNIEIDVVRSVESEAGLISLLDLKAYAGILTFLFIILAIIVMYLLIERKKMKQGEVIIERAPSTKVEKSKYFNIK